MIDQSITTEQQDTEPATVPSSDSQPNASYPQATDDDSAASVEGDDDGDSQTKKRRLQLRETEAERDALRNRFDAYDRQEVGWIAAELDTIARDWLVKNGRAQDGMLPNVRVMATRTVQPAA